jgi:Mitochondrial carrier protein
MAGTAGGFAGKLLDYPFDTIKVLLQTQTQTQHESSGSATATSTAARAAATRPHHQSSSPQYRNAWHCFRHVYQTQGFMSLYRGLSAPLVGSMAENAVLFWMYGHCKRLVVSVSFASGGDLPIWAAKYDESHLRDDDMSLLQLSCAGALAGFGAATVLTPIELIKCRMQVQNNMSTLTAAGPSTTATTTATTTSTNGFVRYASPLDVLWKTVREEGIIRGLYRGHASTLLREIPGNFVWYGIYEAVCRSQLKTDSTQTKSDLSTTTHMMGGAAAGVGYWTAFYPADTVKSMQQTRPQYKTMGFRDVFMHVLKQDGVKGLYRGWTITVIRAAPSHAAIFAIYEQTLQWLN